MPIPNSPTDLVLGIDGGGTKTVAWLAAADLLADGRPLGRGVAGPGNPRSAGFDRAIANLDSAISAAFSDAGLPRQTVAVACLGLAGADRPAERAVLEKWCSDGRIAHQLVLTNDAEPLLAAASPADWGVVIVAGTGSFAFGRNQAGATARCGGWGFLIGDEGSGYSIAIAGLRAATRAADGRAENTQLLVRFQERLKVATPQGLIEALYRPDIQRREIADLAEVVFDTAHAGDRTAQHIIANAASELATLVRAIVDRLQLPTGQYPLIAAGGILIHHPDLRATLEYHLADTPAAPANTVLEPDPVRGAVVLAQKAVRGSDWPLSSAAIRSP